MLTNIQWVTFSFAETKVLNISLKPRSQTEVHRLSADNHYLPFDNRHRPIILFIVEFYFIFIVIISLHYYAFMTHKLKLIHIPFEWIGKCFLVVRRQDSGKVRARPNRILEFPWGRNLFILHRLLNTGMGWAVTKNYKLVKLQQKCYESTMIPLWLHNRYNMTFTEWRCVLK